MTKKYKIGYFTSLEFIESAPPCQRAVREVVDILSKKGHEVIEVVVPNAN